MTSNDCKSHKSTSLGTVLLIKNQSQVSVCVCVVCIYCQKPSLEGYLKLETGLYVLPTGWTACLGPGPICPRSRHHTGMAIVSVVVFLRQERRRKPRGRRRRDLAEVYVQSTHIVLLNHNLGFLVKRIIVEASWLYMCTVHFWGMAHWFGK